MLQWLLRRTQQAEMFRLLQHNANVLAANMAKENVKWAHSFVTFQ
jgi:hypothetical protein